MSDQIRPALAGPKVGGSASRDELVQRHHLVTRFWHWTTALTVFVLLMSGMMIFNAHPALYWGKYGANDDYSWLEIGSQNEHGFLRVGSVRVPTTGILGYTQGQEVAFPPLLTIPTSYDLGAARSWHFFFAWLLVAPTLGFLVWSLFSRHMQRDLLPDGAELRPRHVWRDVVDHALLRFSTREAARRYNVLQKIAYLAVFLVLLPTMILTGLAMSPTMDAAWPWLLWVFDGRQSARSIHFLAASILALFILVHLSMVVLAGPWNEVRSMVTGRYRLPPRRDR